MTTFLLVLLGIETAALVGVIVLYRRMKKAQKQRVVEAPNSTYKSPYVLDLDSQERWEKLDLELLHEVNREEFEKLLQKVQATSVRALAPHEKAFLDRMSDAHDVVVEEAKRKQEGEEGTPRASVPGTS